MIINKIEIEPKKTEASLLCDDFNRLIRKEIDPDDFLDLHPEGLKDKRIWRQIARIYNTRNKKPFSWEKSRHGCYEDYWSKIIDEAKN